MNLYALPNQSLKKHIVKYILEDRLIPLPRCHDHRSYSFFGSRNDCPIEFNHRIVIGLHDLDLVRGVVDHIDDAIFDLVTFGQMVIVEQLVFTFFIKL